jgi:hypothetical protein
MCIGSKFWSSFLYKIPSNYFPVHKYKHTHTHTHTHAYIYNEGRIRKATYFRKYILNERCATSRTVPGSIPGGVTWDYFRGSFRLNHVPWGRLSLWKWVPGISPGVKSAGEFGWRPTALVVPKVEKIRGLNLPGNPRATSACRGTPLFYLHLKWWHSTWSKHL